MRFNHNGTVTERSFTPEPGGFLPAPSLSSDRLESVLVYLCGALGWGLQKADANIAELEDHEGSLCVIWRRMARGDLNKIKDIVGTAWEEFCDEARENTFHRLLQPDGTSVEL